MCIITEKSPQKMVYRHADCCLFQHFPDPGLPALKMMHSSSSPAWQHTPKPPFCSMRLSLQLLTLPSHTNQPAALPHHLQVRLQQWKENTERTFENAVGSEGLMPLCLFGGLKCACGRKRSLGPRFETHVEGGEYEINREWKHGFYCTVCKTPQQLLPSKQARSGKLWCVPRCFIFFALFWLCVFCLFVHWLLVLSVCGGGGRGGGFVCLFFVFSAFIGTWFDDPFFHLLIGKIGKYLFVWLYTVSLLVHRIMEWLVMEGTSKII